VRVLGEHSPEFETELSRWEDSLLFLLRVKLIGCKGSVEDKVIAVEVIDSNNSDELMRLSTQGTLANCYGVINLNIDKKERAGVGGRVRGRISELGDLLMQIFTFNQRLFRNLHINKVILNKYMEKGV
jgi:hypothetical protein